MKWAHNITICYSRGKAVATCSCGLKSEKLPPGEVEVWVAQHKQKYLRETPVKRP